MSTAKEFPVRPFERTAFYQVGEWVRYREYFCYIQRAVSGEELERTWMTKEQPCLVSSSIGDSGPEGESGIIDNINHNTGLLFKLSTANKDDLPKIIVENRKQ